MRVPGPENEQVVGQPRSGAERKRRQGRGPNLKAALAFVAIVTWFAICVFVPAGWWLH